MKFVSFMESLLSLCLRKCYINLLFCKVVFTNLSRDHLDFHSNMDHYFSSKKLLFTDYLKPGGRVVIVLEESPSSSGENLSSREEENNWGSKMSQDLRTLYHTREDSPSIITCGLNSDYDIHANDFNIDKLCS